MTKGDLFSIKTEYGFGLFQVFDSYPNNFHVFCLIYHVQLQNLSEKEIDKVMQKEYYYQRINFGMSKRADKFDLDEIIKNKGVEFSSNSFGIKEDDNYFGGSFITYLGKYEIPHCATIPKYTRQLSLSYFTGKHCWYIRDEMLPDFVRNEKGKPKIFKKLTPDIIKYPLYFSTSPRVLVDNFNKNYFSDMHDDSYVDKTLEEYYIKNPKLRPINEKYDDIKLPIPTASLRAMPDKSKKDENYLALCDVVEKALLKFICHIDENKKNIKSALNELISELNKIEEDTHLIGTLEAEILYSYLAKILKSLNKVQLIDIIEEKRNW